MYNIRDESCNSFLKQQGYLPLNGVQMVPVMDDKILEWLSPLLQWWQLQL